MHTSSAVDRCRFQIPSPPPLPSPFICSSPENDIAALRLYVCTLGIVHTKEGPKDIITACECVTKYEGFRHRHHGIDDTVIR